jgi:peptidoglycan/LPS O-acetylase OafA/YrhL
MLIFLYFVPGAPPAMYARVIRTRFPMHTVNTATPGFAASHVGRSDCLTYRPDVDGLRAVAVLAVVGYHAFPSLVPGGFIGVDVFFAISGFLISTILIRSIKSSQFSYYEFYAGRFRRLAPALLLVLVACLGGGWLTLLATEYQQLGKHVAAGGGFIANLVYWAESGYFDTTAVSKPLLHLWSLGVEEQFYFVWPALLALTWRHKGRFLKAILMIALISFIVNVGFARVDPIATFFSPFSRFWELMLGALLAWRAATAGQTSLLPGNLGSAVGFSIIVLVSLLFTSHHPYPGVWALLPTIAACLIISSSSESWVNRVVLSSRPVVAIGLVSYPWYLWHWPLLSFAQILNDGPCSVPVRLVLVATSLVLAGATYIIVERPIRAARGNRLLPPALAFALVVVAGAGLLVYAEEGFQARMLNGNRAGFSRESIDDPKVDRCFLLEKQTLPFQRDCDGGGIEPLVLVWGDSHARSLALGFASLSRADHFGLAVYTASGCPPVVDFSVSIRPNCREIDDFVLDRIRVLKPKTVILSAFWALYNGHSGWSALDEEKLKNTLTLLKQANIPNIVIFGNVPTYLVPQPRIGIEKFVSGRMNRTYYKFNPDAKRADEKIRAIAAAANVRFVSPIDLLCTRDGCLISSSADELDPIAWDYGHLTKPGAELLLREATQMHALAIP